MSKHGKCNTALWCKTAVGSLSTIGTVCCLRCISGYFSLLARNLVPVYCVFLSHVNSTARATT